MNYSIEVLRQGLGSLGPFIPLEAVNYYAWNWRALAFDLRELGYVYGYHKDTNFRKAGWFNLYEHRPGDVIRDDLSSPLIRLMNSPAYEDRVTGHCTEAKRLNDVVWYFDVQMVKAGKHTLHSQPIYFADFSYDLLRRHLHEAQVALSAALRAGIDKVKQSYMSTTRGLNP